MRTGRKTGMNAKRTKTRTKTSDEADGDGDGDSDDDDEHRHRDDTRGVDERTDGAQTGWTSYCVRGYARFMLAVWAGRGAQAARCLVISFCTFFLRFPVFFDVRGVRIGVRIWACTSFRCSLGKAS